MMEYSKAKTALKEIAARHMKAWEADDSKAMAQAENEALIICDAYDYPVYKINLLLASHWPER